MHATFDVEVIGLNLRVVVSRDVDVFHKESNIPFADNDNGVSQVEIDIPLPCAVDPQSMIVDPMEDYYGAVRFFFTKAASSKVRVSKRKAVGDAGSARPSKKPHTAGESEEHGGDPVVVDQ